MKFRSTRCSGFAKRSLSSGNQALSAGQQFRALAELAEHGDRFLERCCPVIVKWSRIHGRIFLVKTPCRLLASPCRSHQCGKTTPEAAYNDPRIFAIGAIRAGIQGTRLAGFAMIVASIGGQLQQTYEAGASPKSSVRLLNKWQRFPREHCM